MGAGGRTEEREGSTMNDPAKNEEAFDPEQYRRDCEAEIQGYLDTIGRDTPEGKAVLRELEEAKAPIPSPAKAEAEETLLIDLRLLKDSPLHHRHQPSEEELIALARSIEADVLKNPIDVRRDGDLFEIICGHRRVAAYRRLFDAAQTDDERAKYRAIRATVLAGASDLDCIRKGIAEDLIREEFSAADAARSIHVLQALDPQLDSAQKVSDATGLRPRRAGRLLQLDKAPGVVQEAADGIMVDVAGDGEGDGAEGSHQELRKLELMPALEFVRLHTALSAKRSEPAGEAADPSGKETETYADRQTRKAIERALKEQWGFREVKRYVDKAVAALNGSAPKKAGRPSAPFKWKNQCLRIDVKRLDALSGSQKAELRKVMEEILQSL